MLRTDCYGQDGLPDFVEDVLEASKNIEIFGKKISELILKISRNCVKQYYAELDKFAEQLGTLYSYVKTAVQERMNTIVVLKII